MLGEIGEMPHECRIEELAQRIVHGPQLEIDELVVEIGNAAAVEPIGEPVPGLLRRGLKLTPIEKDVALISVELEREAAVEQIVGAAQIFEAGERIAPGNDERRGRR